MTELHFSYRLILVFPNTSFSFISYQESFKGGNFCQPVKCRTWGDLYIQSVWSSSSPERITRVYPGPQALTPWAFQSRLFAERLSAQLHCVTLSSSFYEMWGFDLQYGYSALIFSAFNNLMRHKWCFCEKLQFLSTHSKKVWDQCFPFFYASVHLFPGLKENCRGFKRNLILSLEV